ncbi:MAG: hypothetical protein Q8O64_04305 [Sideroxyarcus sp.]|nr:hypothetical protein [Sideroxyarcus sp.]
MRFGSTPIICTLAVLALLSGCTSAPQHLTETQTNQIRNVAVVSLVPESVNFDKVGIISFSTQNTNFDMGGKVTDSILFISRGRIAKSHPDWIIKHVGYDRTALLAAASSPGGLGATRARQVFADLARNHDLDAIFVLRAAADTATDSPEQLNKNALREGLTVWFKNDELDGDPKLFIRANLHIAIIGKNGEPMAVGSAPAKLDLSRALKPADYGLTTDMKHNHHPEILDRLGREVVLDLNRRLNLGFDALGLLNGSSPEVQHVNVVPPIGAGSAPKENPPPQLSPDQDSFDQCFSRCRQSTDRSKEQCFDVCNGSTPRIQP